MSVEDVEEWCPPVSIRGLFGSTDGNIFSAINSAKAGPQNTNTLPKGNAPLQLYSLATPNGQKVGIMLEELGIPYDAFVINLTGQQFSQGFYEVNPNSKIPAAIDMTKSGQRIRLFESGSIVVYLAQKYNRFIPSEPAKRAECLNWCFWQVGGQGPMV